MGKEKWVGGARCPLQILVGFSLFNWAIVFLIEAARKRERGGTDKGRLGGRWREGSRKWGDALEFLSNGKRKQWEEI